jgi:Tfp pilus assembly protein PilN
MSNHKKIYLNLASNPMRNRRLFLILIALFSVSICLVLSFGGKIFFQYRGKAHEAEHAVAQTEKQMSDAQRATSQLDTRLEKMQEQHGEEIEFINGLIYSKSFSWIDFFSALEEALPASSAILSMSPYPEEGLSMEVRFKVASASMNELLNFIARLAAKGFKDIQILTESKSPDGHSLSEISLRYERNI